MQSVHAAFHLGLTCSRCFEPHLPAHEGEQVLDCQGMAPLALHFRDGSIQALQLHQPSRCVVQARCVTVQNQLLHRWHLITCYMFGVQRVQSCVWSEPQVDLLAVMLPRNLLAASLCVCYQACWQALLQCVNRSVSVVYTKAGIKKLAVRSLSNRFIRTAKLMDVCQTVQNKP